MPKGGGQVPGNAGRGDTRATLVHHGEVVPPAHEVGQPKICVQGMHRTPGAVRAGFLCKLSWATNNTVTKIVMLRKTDAQLTAADADS